MKQRVIDAVSEEQYSEREREKTAGNHYFLSILVTNRDFSHHRPSCYSVANHFQSFTFLLHYQRGNSSAFSFEKSLNSYIDAASLSLCDSQILLLHCDQHGTWDVSFQNL
ncbi:hypothetical protein ES332_A07G021600v1 [Gossypium tomentosum]|uniref:Uncharacterized protein n=1 Tax=Gossypium tomentosum TaxID=34277 RepID=A0A5D2PNC7_GOSTO|nr:hypothetical protein ES332_A07G021600v1 [Gossypium tomentosum]